MKKLSLSLGMNLLFASTLIAPVMAQTPDPEITPVSETGSAADLRVTPRIGASFTTNGPGYEAPYFGLEGFVPLQQNPGNSLTFL